MLYFGCTRLRRELYQRELVNCQRPCRVRWSVGLRKHHRPGADAAAGPVIICLYFCYFLGAAFLGALLAGAFLGGCFFTYSASRPPIRVRASAALNGYSWIDV